MISTLDIWMKFLAYSFTVISTNKDKQIFIFQTNFLGGGLKS